MPVPSVSWTAAPRIALPSLDEYKVAKHTKGNALGIKAERPNLREVPKRHFQKVATIDDLVDKLFGS